MTSNVCGCCESPAGLTPAVIDNRPALPAVAYRVGTFSSFRKSMLHGIASTPELVDLRMRRSDDYAITILELWAAVGEVLTFYQERIANDAFLRTALHRDSVLRLVRLIAYELAPGAAATTLLAFIADEKVTVPERLLVQSVPAADEKKPQKFETLKEITAYPALNTLRIVAPPVGVNPLAQEATEAYLTPGTEALEIMQSIAPGDQLFLYNVGANDLPEMLTVKELRVEFDRVVLVWERPVQGTVWNLDTNATRYLRSFRLFGHNAPQSYLAPASTPGADGTDVLDVEWRLKDTDYTYTDPGTTKTKTSTLALDSRYEDIGVGARLLVVIGASSVPSVHEVAVTAVKESQDTVGPVSDTVTSLTVSPRISELHDSMRYDVQIHQLQVPSVRFWGYTYPGTFAPTTVLAPGVRTGDTTIEVARLIAGTEIEAGADVAVEEVDVGRQVILQDATGAPLSATITAAAVVGLDVIVEPTPLDETTASELGLDGENAEKFAGIVSSSLDPSPALTSATPALTVTIGSIGPLPLSLDSTLTDVEARAKELQQQIRAADPDEAFVQARVFKAESDRIVIVPGTDGLTVAFGTSDDDETTVVELGLDAVHAVPVTGLLSGASAASATLTAAAPEVQVTIGTTGPRTIAIATGSTPLAQRIQETLRTADPAPSFDHVQVILSDDDRLIVLPGVVGHTEEDYLRMNVRTTETDPRVLDRTSSVLAGNIAAASHGETVADEVLGNADATVEFQEFTLKKSPVTHLALAAGVESTLELLVDRSLWREVSSLFGASETDQVFRTRLDDDGNLTVVFGGGGMGAIPATGRSNLVATYRRGLGLEGRVGAESITTLLDRPQGLTAVMNPSAADGSADPETLANARDNAPATVRTFGRAVSLRDFEYLSLASGEVAKAQATWVWHRERRAVHLTVAAQEGALLSPDGLARIHAGLTAVRDPNHTLLVDNYQEVPIRVEATVYVDDDRIASEVEAATRGTLLAALSFDNLDFGRPIHVSDIYSVLHQVDGVKYVDVDVLMFKQPAGTTAVTFDAFLDLRGVRRLAGGLPAPLQGHLRIYPARTHDAVSVLPAEIAAIEDASRDVVLRISGGLPD